MNRDPDNQGSRPTAASSGTPQTEKTTKKGRLIVISGPSGAGKSTLTQAAAARTKTRLSISATTRPPGRNEEKGRDYYFLSEEEFTRRIKHGEFLEYARVFDYAYGTPAPAVQEQLTQGQSVILEIDVQGALQVFAKAPDAVGILVLPPNPETLRSRLRGRRRDDEVTIQKRLAKANWEMETAQESGQYQYTVINDDLNRATEEIVQIINMLNEAKM